MTKPLRIDFVSDVVCPWCVIGLGGLEEALRRLGDDVAAEIHIQPFELNPDMPPEGENRLEHITKKYGTSAEQARLNRERIEQRAASVGFAMHGSDASRVYNTFNAHRLLHWAGESRGQLALKKALFDAYFTAGLDIGDTDVLAQAAGAAGLDPEEARAVIASDRYRREVRADEALWQQRGIHAVPAVVVNERYLISGGQPAEVFEDALRKIAGEA